MKEITFEEMKILQMDILDVLHKFCNEKKINYSLGCGSMLGAIRHQGYIPWDDDIDIYLLREDYEKLLKLFPNQLNNVAIRSLERNKDWDYAFAKAIDVRTHVVETDVENKPSGVNIDIFAIDKAPGTEKEWQSYNKKRRLVQTIYRLKCLSIKKEYSFWKNLYLVLSKFLLLPFTLRQLAEFVNKYAQKYNGSDSSLIFENIQGWRLKHPFSRKAMESFVTKPFEDRQYLCMIGYDEYLTNAYGDYMKLPPKEKQVAHHSFVPYWK